MFGTIVVVGMNIIVQSGINLLNPRNSVIVAVILILGVGGLRVEAGGFALEGIGISSLLGILLNGLLPQGKLDRS